MAQKPTVWCLCLTADRQEFTTRAILSFNAQSYKKSWMMLFDSGMEMYKPPAGLDMSRVAHCRRRYSSSQTVGALRNEAIALIPPLVVVAHWDSDDYSHPERLAVELDCLEGGMGNEVVGFHNLLFFDNRIAQLVKGKGAAWEYDYKRLKQAGPSAKVIGTSLMYFREVWQRRPFTTLKTSGEDTDWTKQLNVTALNGVATEYGPLMIAEVHGRNTSGVYQVFDKHDPRINAEWRRAPEYDSLCAGWLYS